MPFHRHPDYASLAFVRRPRFRCLACRTSARFRTSSMSPKAALRPISSTHDCAFKQRGFQAMRFPSNVTPRPTARRSAGSVSATDRHEPQQSREGPVRRKRPPRDRSDRSGPRGGSRPLGLPDTARRQLSSVETPMPRIALNSLQNARILPKGGLRQKGPPACAAGAKGTPASPIRRLRTTSPRMAGRRPRRGTLSARGQGMGGGPSVHGLHAAKRRVRGSPSCCRRTFSSMRRRITR